MLAEKQDSSGFLSHTFREELHEDSGNRKQGHEGSRKINKYRKGFKVV